MTIDPNIPHEYLWLLRRTDGYLDLNMLGRARQELEGFPKRYRDATAYREIALRLAMDEEDWPTVEAVARTLLNRKPNDPVLWIDLAYATRRLESVEAASAILSEARDRFPNEPIIPFNLACYACQLGNKTSALQLLEQATALAPQCRAMALEDEDLEPIWGALESQPDS